MKRKVKLSNRILLNFLLVSIFIKFYHGNFKLLWGQASTHLKHMMQSKEVSSPCLNSFSTSICTGQAREHSLQSMHLSSLLILKTWPKLAMESIPPKGQRYSHQAFMPRKKTRARIMARDERARREKKPTMPLKIPPAGQISQKSVSPKR